MSSSSSSYCPPTFCLDDAGRQPIGVAQQLGHEFPLVQPSEDIRYLLADAYLNYDDPADYDATLTEYTLPFSLKWIFGAGCSPAPRPDWAPIPAHTVDILIVDADDRTVFDSTQAANYMSEVWSDRLTIYEWFNDSDVARIVVHTCWQDNYIDPRNYPQHLAPTAAVLDSRVTTRQPKRLKSIIVGLQTMKDIIEFDAGFNIAMTGVENIADDTLANTQRDGYRFTIDGTLGGGRGKFPGCDTLDIAARRINGVVPNEYGDFLVSPEECYWYERPSTVINEGSRYYDASGNLIEIDRLVDVTPNTAQLHNDCTPCCDCDEFVETKQRLDEIFADWKLLGQRAEATRDTYNNNRDRWLEQKTCRENQPQRLIVEASCDGNMGIGYSFCNTTKDCKGPLIVTLAFETFEHGGSGAVAANKDVKLVPDVARKNDGLTGRMRPYTMGGAWPTYTAEWETLNAFHSGRLSFLLKGCDTIDGNSLRVTVTAVFADEAYPAITEVTSFEGDCEPADPCPASA